MALATKKLGWIDILAIDDSQALWNKLFNLVAKHSSTRLLYSPDELTGNRRYEICSDLTQDLFLRLLEKKRWQYYLDNGYTSERVEQELFRIEVPNYISVLQRERFPESYRLARRISELLKSRSEFRRFSPACADGPVADEAAWPTGKMALRVYGLSQWPDDKALGYSGDLMERLKEVPYRCRDVRRMGRGSGSQVIISNEDLTRLIIAIFTALDTPLPIRRARALVMSKLAVEDSRPVSLENRLANAGDDGAELPRLDLPDQRPNPLDALLAKETTRHLERVVEALLRDLRDAVRNKPQRFYKLVAIAWSCYFDPASPSQTTIARRMKISDSLVSHYRGIFDSFVQGLNLTIDEYIQLNGMLGSRLDLLRAEGAGLAWPAERVERQRKLRPQEAVIERKKSLAMTAARAS